MFAFLCEAWHGNFHPTHTVAYLAHCVGGTVWRGDRT